MTEELALVQKVWNYAHVLRDAGVSAGEYVEQITCLLFLKMDDERSKGLGEPSVIPAKHRWESFRALTGEALARAYTKALEELGRSEGLVARCSRRRGMRSKIRRACRSSST